MRLEINSCDLGLTEEYGTCAVDTSATLSDDRALARPQRLARGFVGIGFIGLAGLLASPKHLRPLSAVALWFGASHVVAATTGYTGCPELGAIPSTLMRRPVATQCGPWDWVDQRLCVAP